MLYCIHKPAISNKEHPGLDMSFNMFLFLFNSSNFEHLFPNRFVFEEYFNVNTIVRPRCRGAKIVTIRLLSTKCTTPRIVQFCSRSSHSPEKTFMFSSSLIVWSIRSVVLHLRHAQPCSFSTISNSLVQSYIAKSHISSLNGPLVPLEGKSSTFDMQCIGVPTKIPSISTKLFF